MKIPKTIISNLETGTPEVPESKIPFLIGENSFIDMDVRAVNRKGNKIKLIPGNAKYPSEEKFEKIGKGMMTKIFPLFDYQAGDLYLVKPIVRPKVTDLPTATH